MLERQRESLKKFLGEIGEALAFDSDPAHVLKKLPPITVNWPPIDLKRVPSTGEINPTLSVVPLSTEPRRIEPEIEVELPEASLGDLIPKRFEVGLLSDIEDMLIANRFSLPLDDVEGLRWETNGVTAEILANKLHDREDFAVSLTLTPSPEVPVHTVWGFGFGIR